MSGVGNASELRVNNDIINTDKYFCIQNKLA